MIITEPRWKSLIVETTTPIFTPEQCKLIIEAGKKQPRQDGHVGGKEGGTVDTKTRLSHISWIPFDVLPEMYKKLEQVMNQTNGNHFGFEGMKITELAQFTEYSGGGFYDWHMDSDVNGIKEPPVRKISMTCLLSNEDEFEGGGLELMSEGKFAKIKQGHAIFFASYIQHRVVPVTKGVRNSLVMWFGGTPFK
jgi:PKHD-type hydroxylase|tara:strand:+ start:2941 stop:3519 length:579 start_codon:yes stop_codon:yes gene_type:complete